MEDFGGYTQNGQGNPYITGDPTANFTHHPQSHPIPQPDLTPGAAFFHSLDQTQQQRQPSQQFVHPSFEQNGFYAIAPQTYFSHPDSMSANNHQMGLAMQYPQMQQLFPFASISSATPESYLQQPMDFQYGSRLPNQYAGPVRLSLDPQSQHNQPQSQFEIYQPEVKARANITDEHRKFLELKFAETPYPSSEEKAAIGAQIGLQSDVITRWYERQRKVLGIRKDKLLQNSSLSTLQISALPTQEIVNKRSRSQADDSDDILSPQMHQGIAKTPEEVIKSSSLLKETLVHCVSRTSSYNSKEGIRFVFEVMKIATTDAQKLIILHGIRDNAKKEPLQLLSETQILARMRNWFTSAIKEKSLQMLVACLEVFKKMPLTSEALANVKLAKPILLALKKYPESSAVGALSKHLIPLAQKATSIDGDKPVKSDLSTMLEEGHRKKQKLSNPSTAEAPSSKPLALGKKGIAAKYVEKVATSANSNFFKNIKEPIKATKPTFVKPSQQSISSLINSINVTKKKPGVPTTRIGPQASVLTQALGQPKDTSAVVQPEVAPEPVVSRKRKRVTWAPDHELEKIKIIEALDLEHPEDLFHQTPHQFGNARDLDISEGRAAFSHKNLDMEEEEDDVPWTFPLELDFREMRKSEEVNIDSWATRRGGVKQPESREAGIQRSREQDVLAVFYVKEQDIPPSPAEPLPGSEGEVLHTRTIPLPKSLKTLQNPIGSQGTQNFPPQISNMGQVDLQSLLGSILGGMSHQNAPQSLGQFSGVVNPELRAPPSQVQPPIDLGTLLQSIQGNGGALPLFNNQYTQPVIPSYNALQTSTSPMDPNPGQEGSPRLRDVRPFVVTAPQSAKYRQICKFYGEGKCRKGNDCDYVHLAPSSR